MSGNELKETGKNLITQNNNNDQSKCSGKKCNNIPKHLFEILFINKKCWFCDRYKQYLQDNDLIDDTTHNILEMEDEP